MKKKLILAAKAVAAVLIVFAIVMALTRYWPIVRHLAGSLEYHWLALAFALCVVYRVLNAAGWGLILRSLGHTMPTIHGVRLWLVAETMRWLPGSIWGYCSRVYQAQQSGVPALAASLSMPLELAVTVLAWSVVAVAGGHRVIDFMLNSSAVKSANSETVTVILAVLLVALGVFLFCARGENPFVKKVRKLLGDLRLAFHAHPQPQYLAAAFAWFVVLGVVNGITFQILLRAFTPELPGMTESIGINAIGWLAGFFAIFSPGGLGVREGVITALLAPLLPLDVAVGAVVLWRVLQILAEIVCLAVCYFLPAAVRFVRERIAVSPISHHAR